MMHGGDPRRDAAVVYKQNDDRSLPSAVRRPPSPVPRPFCTATRPPTHSFDAETNKQTKVEELQQVGNPNENEMDRYLKAVDDLQTVLGIHDGVLDGKKTLPLSRGGGGGGGSARGSTGEATAAAEAAFAATAASSNGHHRGSGTSGVFSSDDESLENSGGGGGGGTAGRAAAAAAASAAAAAEAAERSSGGRSSPARGNLLDLEENTPLEAGMLTGHGAGGMMVAFANGQFMASTNTAATNSVGGVSGLSGVEGVSGFNSSSSAGRGSTTTASNFASASDTGAVYGSGSNNFGSNSNNYGSGGGIGTGGDGPLGFGE